MKMGIDDKIGNGNGKEWEGMGNNLHGNENGPYSHGINSHRRLVLMTVLFCIENYN